MALVRGAVRHYCLGGCSALVVCARRSRPARGGWSRCWVLCLPRFSLSAPCFLRCVWRAVPSGCPLSSLAGTPCHAVCAFHGLGQVALLVFPACPLCVCALALSRRSRPPPLPGLVWHAHLARARCWVLVGWFHAVRARPRVLPRSRAPFGLLGERRPGPVSPYLASGCALPVGWVRAWGPVTNPTARALASWLCALWGRHEGARGGRLLPGCGTSGVGRSPTSDHSSFRACCPGPLPTGCGCGGCGLGDPSPTPQRPLLRAGLARCGGGKRMPGGAHRAWVPGVRGRALSHPRSLVLLGRAAGAHYPLAVVARVRAWGPFTNPTARAPASWLCALWGRHEGARAGHLLPGVGRPGSGAVPPPTTRPFGRASGAHYPLAWVQGMRAWGPVTNPTARALASWLCALWGRHEGARGRRLLPGCGAPGVGRSPNLDRSSFRACGRGPLPTGLGAGDAGVGTCHQPHRARSWELALRAVGAARGGPGGAPLAWVWGARGRALFPPPTTRPFGRAARGPLPTGRGCRVRALGPGCPWHLLPCRGSLCVVSASRVRGTRWPLWLCTCPRAVVVAGGVPLWRASWPLFGALRLVRSGCSRCSGRLSRRCGAFSHSPRPRLYLVAARGTWRPAENRALCACRWPLPRQGRWAPSALYL